MTFEERTERIIEEFPYGWVPLVEEIEKTARNEGFKFLRTCFDATPMKGGCDVETTYFIRFLTFDKRYTERAEAILKRYHSDEPLPKATGSKEDTWRVYSDARSKLKTPTQICLSIKAIKDDVLLENGFRSLRDYVESPRDKGGLGITLEEFHTFIGYSTYYPHLLRGIRKRLSTSHSDLPFDDITEELRDEEPAKWCDLLGIADGRLKESSFKTLGDYVKGSPKAGGLGLDLGRVGQLLDYNPKFKELAEKLKGRIGIVELSQATNTLNPIGGDRRSSDFSPGNAATTRGNSREYRIAKLKRDFPEVAARLESGEFKTVAEAERAAGTGKAKQTSVEKIQRAISKLNESERAEVMVGYARVDIKENVNTEPTEDSEQAIEAEYESFMATLPKSAGISLKAAVKRLHKLYQGRFTVEVEAEVDKQVAEQVKDKLEWLENAETAVKNEAERIAESNSSMESVITRDNFMIIRGCLHPDKREAVTDATLNKAFKAFNALRKTIYASDPIALYEEMGWHVDHPRYKTPKQQAEINAKTAATKAANKAKKRTKK